MTRILVLGCSGSGKTTLATNLAEQLQLPYINLDEHYWRRSWTPTPMAEWKSISNQLADEDSWIMDGSYGSTLDYRLQRCDCIIYLDYSTWTCLTRVLRRTARHLGRTRPHMTDGCPERFDIHFLHYVLTYRIARRQNHLARIKKQQGSKAVYIVSSSAQLTAVEKQLGTNQKRPPEKGSLR